MQKIGNLEETILLIIMAMDDDSYGFSVSEAYLEHTGNTISISAVHTVMSRLEEKGLIASEMGGESAERGGRRKRIFKATPKGVEVIEELKASRQKLWSLIPGLA
jgi:DNA-binding PadR family transcriptional regulator